MKGQPQAVSNRSHRGEAVINDVFDATREELAQVGYRALRIENVAARANVNRTTIYRRWPTKEDLVRDALHNMFAVDDEDPDTGTIRGDLLVVAGGMCEFLQSANGQVLVRMMMTEGPEEGLRGIVDALREEKDAALGRILERGKARRELRADLDHRLFIGTLIGGLHHYVFVLGVAPTQIDVAKHVDLIIHGAASSAPTPKKKKHR